jgi:hypothetical protein
MGLPDPPSDLSAKIWKQIWTFLVSAMGKAKFQHRTRMDGK